MTIEEANNELQRRCNGIKNPNHVLQIALRMQEQIYDDFEAPKTCDGCVEQGVYYQESKCRFCDNYSLYTAKE